MPTPYELPRSPIAPGVGRPVHRLERPVQGRYVAGVCAGLAEHLGLSVRHVRLAFVLASIAGGAGVAAYLFLWALTPQSRGGDLGPGAQPVAVGRPANESLRNLVVGVGLLLLGGVLVAQRQGVNLRLGVLIPLFTVAGGAVLAWSQLDDAERGRWLVGGGEGRRAGLLRLGIGIALATIGVVALATQGRGFAGLWDVGIPAVAVLAGAALIAAPWGVRLWSDLRVEQAQRIRETERADIAAHLHDSVLQTLALIQRQSSDPHAVAQLARTQERELRRWLFEPDDHAGLLLSTALRDAAAEVEDAHSVPVEVVVVGDVPVGDGYSPLVAATREALQNAAKHSGAQRVDVYAEVGADGVEIFVRDRGVGFDPATVPADRLGLRGSIVDRMVRHGGSSDVRSQPGDGTEVRLWMPAESSRQRSGTWPTG